MGGFRCHKKLVTGISNRSVGGRREKYHIWHSNVDPRVYGMALKMSPLGEWQVWRSGGRAGKCRGNGSNFKSLLESTLWYPVLALNIQKAEKRSALDLLWDRVLIRAMTIYELGEGVSREREENWAEDCLVDRGRMSLLVTGQSGLNLWRRKKDVGGKPEGCEDRSQETRNVSRCGEWWPVFIAMKKSSERGTEKCPLASVILVV